jgi:formylglycine-generating enzyme required for sulfatase activity
VALPLLILAACFLPLLAQAAKQAPAYETVPLPPGGMSLQVPINSYLETEYLSVPVTVTAGLRLGRFEVSNAEWDACFDAGACGSKAERRPDEGPDYPVVRVNWHEAMQFARWLSTAKGKHYRLPTEGEWYYAFSLGQGFKVQSRLYDYRDIEAVKRVPKKTWKRGRFGQNAWGLADMLGNVWEWTLSCYTLAESRLLSPPDLAALSQAGACSTRIVGGQNRAHVPDFIRDTYNGGCATVEPTANLGFRLIEEE